MSEPLPTFVVRYRRSVTDTMPKVVPTNHKMASIEEKKLRRFFKCTKFNLKTGLKSDQCFVCKNSVDVFEDHLKTKHPKQVFYCCYCYPKPNISEQDKKYLSADKLVRHMIEAHRHRRYQCNLCLYRAISAEHVDIHQSIIHSDIYKSSKQLNGKTCKVIECPPPTEESKLRPIPTYVQIFNNHKNRRLNNDEKHNKDYQCVYCDYMNENVSKVVEHCVQTHPDFHILYYVPEPLVTSTHSPIRAPQYTDIDVFNTETQDNRVTSTECDAVKEYMKTKENCQKQVDEFAFKKKPRVSTVHTGPSSAVPAGLSSKRLNKDSHPSTSGIRRMQKPSGGYLKLGGPNPATKRFNQLSNRPMPKSARIDFLRRNPSFVPKRRYQSDDSEEEVTHRCGKSSLPPLISPQKKTDKPMICMVCDGNQRKFTESQISSHITMYHDPKIARGNKVPFMCGYCRNFFDSEQDASVKIHQRSCSKRSENSDYNVVRMIVTEDMYYRNRPNERPKQRPINRLNERPKQLSNERPVERTTPKSVNKSKNLKRIVLLSEDEYEDIESDITSPPILRKQSSTESKPKEPDNWKASRTPKRVRIDSTSKGYQSSDSLTSVPETDREDDSIENRPQPSTSCMTTTIERVEDEDLEEEKQEYVCLFCDQTSSCNTEAVEHMESHLLEINEAMDDSKKVETLNKWLKTFVDKQMSLFEDEKDIDDIEHHYKCPICAKIARIKQLRPKRFRYFWQLRNHFWEHTFWTPVKCLLCKQKPNSDFPNCDYLVAKHLNAKHSEDLANSKEMVINLLLGNKVKGEFHEKHRWALREHNFIQINRYEPLDKQIEAILKEISDQREAQLREQVEKERKMRIILPNLEIQPLPPLNYDDDKMVELFLANNESQSRRNRKLVKNRTETDPKKPIHVMDIGSSSEDDEENEAPIVIIRKKPKLFEDSDDEQNDGNSSAQNEDSDDGIEVVAEVKSVANSTEKSSSNKSDYSEEEDNEVVSSNDKTRDELNSNQSSSVKSEEETDPKPKEEETTKQLIDTSDNERQSSHSECSDHQNEERCKFPPPSTPAADQTTSSAMKRYKCLCQEQLLYSYCSQ